MILKYFTYWGKHWYAFQKTAFEYKVWKPKMVLHDIYKPFLNVLFNPKLVHKWHRKWSSHHVENPKGTKKYDLVSMIIDWECARFTKPDKPLNARQTMEKYYPEMSDKLEPLLKKLNL